MIYEFYQEHKRIYYAKVVINTTKYLNAKLKTSISLIFNLILYTNTNFA
ncbi:hypothetical protein VIDI103191_20735 [Vibrio diazotrophicus]